MKSDIFTCKGCQIRHPGCHDKCAKYQAEKKAHEALKAEKKKHDDLQASLDYQREVAVRRALREGRHGR